MSNNWDKRYRKLKEQGNLVFQRFPDAAVEFKANLNPGIDPEKVAWSSGKKINWVCRQCGNQWSASPNNRFSGNQWRPCPECARKVADAKRRETASEKSGSIAESAEKFLREWDWKRNEGLNPYKISINSTHKFWWVCSDCKESFRASASHRINGGTDHRSCAFAAMGDRYRRKAGERNFFGRKYPELLAEWDFEANTDPPENYSVNSNISVHWRCGKGHSFKKSVTDRTPPKSSGCPECSVHGTSRNELRIYCELAHFFPNIIWRNKDFGVEIDILLPDLSVGIEYDGSYWHGDKTDQDLKKTKFLAEHGITLIRIREAPLPCLTRTCIPVPYEPLSVASLCKILKKLVDVSPALPPTTRDELLATRHFNRDADFKRVLTKLPAPPESESFFVKCPAKAKFWDYEANFPLTPDLFLPRSGIKVHWRCPECDYRFEKTIDRVFSNKHVCRQCAISRAANQRVQNNDKGTTALIIRPSLEAFLSGDSLDRAANNRPGSSKPITLVCPNCGESKESTLKQAVKNKFLCRSCGLK